MSNTEPQDPIAEVCYRHPDRTTGVTCQRCDRMICGECSKQASVGVHCPECTKGTAQRVYTAKTLPGAQGTVTRALVGINAALFVICVVFLGASSTGIGQAGLDFGTWGIPIAEDNEIWRLVSGGFLHSGIIHIGFNMYLLWQLGLQLERNLGSRDYLLAYMVAMLGGSFGAILLDPQAPAVGASGAVFGLIGMTVFLHRSRGIGLFDTGLGFLIGINVLFSFSGGISLGGHMGGLLIGLLLGVLYFGVNQGDGALIADSRQRLAAVAGLGLLLIPAAYFAAMTWANPLLG